MSQPLLESGVQEYVNPDDDEIVLLRSQLGRLERRVVELEASRDLVKRDAVIVVLNLLTKSLKQVAEGKFDIDDSPSSAVSSKWEAIKQRNPGRISEAIDVLLIHGSISTSQLAANLKMNRTNCSGNLVPKLISMGICQRNGGLLQLKDN